MKGSMQRDGHTKTRLKHLALAVAVLATLGACSVVQNVRDPEPTFNLTQHAVYLQAGLASIHGTVRVGSGPTAQTCAGGRVYLLPDTPFFAYKYRAIVKGDDVADVGLEDDRFDNIVRRTQCSSTGQYAFDTLPEAPWIVVTTLSLPKGQVGPAVAARVSSKSGLTLTVDLDQNSVAKK